MDAIQEMAADMQNGYRLKSTSSTAAVTNHVTTQPGGTNMQDMDIDFECDDQDPFATYEETQRYYAAAQSQDDPDQDENMEYQ